LGATWASWIDRSVMNKRVRWDNEESAVTVLDL
jgi:hypothetical protein